MHVHNHLMCILFMPVQSCDLICVSDWRSLYVARATRALYTFVQIPSLRMHERGLGTRLGHALLQKEAFYGSC